MTLKSTKTATETVLNTTPQLNTQSVSVLAKVHAKYRHNQIAKAAYLLAEKGNFKGDSIAHWLQAEVNIDRKLPPK